jgi:hypothetical protein
MKSIREYFEEVETTKEYDTEFEEKGKKTSEWHYYISSRKVSARDLLYPARMEWSVEFMHWLPDVHFGEGFATPRIEMFRKISISSENSPYPLSNRLKYKPPPNTPFPTSCLTAFLSLTLLSLFGVKIDFRVFAEGVLTKGGRSDKIAALTGGPPVRSACFVFPDKGIAAKGGILQWKFIPSPSPKAAGARFWPWSFCRSSGTTLKP